MGEVDQILRGGVAFGLAIAGLFFLRFWRDTKDRLFAYFAVAFFTLAANRFGLAMMADHHSGDRLYWIRLAAFAVILFAIWDKNRSGSGVRPAASSRPPG